MDAPIRHLRYAPADSSEATLMASDVNLDALIPKEDLAERHDVPNLSGTINRINVTDLEKGFLVATLRKPDFQRETSDWDPQKILDLIRTFVDGDLVPGVILWQSGGRVFVIDGAHRLSALLAWVHNDFGDGDFRSKASFKHQIPPEQSKVAERVRKLVHAEIGAYSEYGSAARGESKPDEKIQKRLGKMGIIGIPVSWVPAVTAEQAEESFFKINQAATPISDTELRILRARKSANAIASRAINRGGVGHEYWKDFQTPIKEEIVSLAKGIHAALYDPPLEKPIKTLDVPVAGSGYDALQFIFDLVNVSNNSIPPDAKKRRDQDPKKNVKNALPDDTDGRKTVEFLRGVYQKVSRITGDNSASQGLHPAVYFYTLGGSFQPSAFIAWAEILHDLDQQKKLKDFQSVRHDFEEFLLAHRHFITQLVSTRGSRGRSRNRIKEYYQYALAGFIAGKTGEVILKDMSRTQEFAALVVTPMIPDLPDEQKKAFSRNVKTAIYITEALESAPRCNICRARLHRNSIHHDHVVKKSDGGKSDISSGKLTHPYCDSSKG